MLIIEDLKHVQPKRSESVFEAMREMLREDLKFIRGEGRYVDDIKLEDILWLGVVRSQYARAKINSIDTSELTAASTKVVDVYVDHLS